MKICLRICWPLARDAAAVTLLVFAFEAATAAASYSSPTTSVPSVEATSHTSPPPMLSLGNVTIGASVLETVKRLGPPDVVQTTDLGHEWQWVEATGIDREVLADDDLIVRQILVAQPARIPDQTPPPLVQPAEFKALGIPVDDAAGAIAAGGGNPIVEPDPAVRAWDFPGGVLVGELENGVVGRLLALDDVWARRLGYLQPPPAADAPLNYRAPVLTQEFYAAYPPDALRANIEGTAVVRVLIDSGGAPKDARIVVTSGNSEIDGAALESVRRSKFRAARCDDVPCPGVYFDLQQYSIFR